MKEAHCVKSVRIWSYSGQHFPAFGLITERYGDTFHPVAVYWITLETVYSKKKFNVILAK